MSYCVNCGVELDASATKCPLCDTPVYNPKAPEPSTQPSPFRRKRSGGSSKRKDLGVLLTVIVLATAVTCGLLNTCIPEQSMVPCGDRSIPGIVGDYDPCSHLYETACLSVDSVRRCGGDRVSVSADLSDGTEWLVLWIGHSGGAACHSGGRSGDFLYP